MTYDAATPLVPDDGTEDPVDTTTPPPAATPTPAAPAPPGPVATPVPTSAASLTSVKAGEDGTLLLEAFAKKSLLAAAPPTGTLLVAKASGTAKAGGSVTLTLRPTARAKTQQRKKGKLAVTLRLTFTPKGAKAQAPLSKKATLRYSRR